MKVLTLEPNCMLPKDILDDEYKRTIRQIRENGVLMKHLGFNYEVIDIDIVEEKPKFKPMDINLDVASLYPKTLNIRTDNPHHRYGKTFKEFADEIIEKKKEKNMKIKVDPHDVVNRIRSICRVLDLELALMELENTPEKCFIHVSVSDPKTHKDMGIYIWPNELECGWGAGIYNYIKEWFGVKCDKNGFAIKEYCTHDIEMTKEIYRTMFNSRYGAKGEFGAKAHFVKHPGLPEITDVRFNGPATIIFWADDTKTVVKCEGEDFDPEKGLAMAIAKKALGNKYDYFNVIKKYTKRYYKAHPKKEEKK